MYTLTLIKCSTDFKYEYIEEFGQFEKVDLSDDELRVVRNYATNIDILPKNSPTHKRMVFIRLVEKSKFIDSEFNNFCEYAILSKNNIEIETPWGCWNRKNSFYYMVKNGYDSNGKMKFKKVINILSKECKYSQDTENDPRCCGCINKHIGEKNV